MKHVRRVIVIFLVVAGLAGAAETFTEKHDFGNDGLLWDYGSQAWTDNQSVTWIHTLSGFNSSTSVTKATLPINSSGVEDDWSNSNAIQAFSGQKLAFLKGASTGFEVLPPQDIINAYTNDSGDFQSGRYRGNSHNRSYSTRRDYTKYGDGIPVDHPKYPEFCDPKPIPPAAVPAPSAILLAGLGTTVVGLLRSRKRVYI